ncbi:hypothetical protein AVEN_8547-1 [Araneus ventricosus]|uniref:Mutator-like transposase domain-containing protein n=1 Tax=Araneus ventricosus TaxID=182803 RepID=A0A4Y2V676_ARAVE|nr:hypothetical protein AVEN_8547-1 [Araneus ventricosus]
METGTEILSRNSVPKNNVSTASATKLNTLESSDGLEYDFQELNGNRIIDIQTLLGVFSILSCPKCFATGLKLTEDSKEGLCSNFAIVCKCGFMARFTSTPKENKKCSLNTLLVFGLRLSGRGFSAGMKLLCTLNLPYVCKKTFRIHELKLLEAVKYSCEENMKAASKEVQNLKKTTTCGVSVDGTWQRRGHMSLNGCVSVISIDTGKILDLEVMTQYCKMCEMNIKCDHECSIYKGSSGNMESVGAFRIFERSVMKRELQYTEYYGDGDSKAFLKVKDIYGEDTVTKLECIGHVQKRVGSRLRKFKKNQRTRWKSNRNLMHGQCPDGKDSWCRYKRAISDKRQYLEKSPGLPNSVMKVIKATYLELCDKNLLKKACMKRWNTEKKYILVPKDEISKHVPTEDTLSELDREMSVILKNGRVLDDEKVKLYMQVLQKRLNIQDHNNGVQETIPEPVSAQHTEEEKQNLVKKRDLVEKKDLIENLILESTLKT